MVLLRSDRPMRLDRQRTSFLPQIDPTVSQPSVGMLSNLATNTLPVSSITPIQQSTPQLPTLQIAPQLPVQQPLGANDNGINIPPTGLIGSEQALQQGLGGALSSIGRGADIAGGVLQPFAGGGASSFAQQLALSGASGPEAQRQAIAQFSASPGQQFLQEQGQRALLRNASAIGGLGGGNVRRELVRQGIGFAQQDFGDQFNRLGFLSQIGAGAAGQQAGIAQRAGEFGGQAILGTGQDLAGGRTRAGEGIAGAIGGTGSALADLISRQGQGISDILGQGTGSLANLLAEGGRGQQLSQEQLATLIANIATGSGSQVAGLPGLPGLRPNESQLGNIGTLAAGAGTAIAAFSDLRLKKNINKVGQTDKGINFYTWDWNEIGRKITGKKYGFGVIAQEIRKIIPEAVINGRWLMVDYGKVF